MRTATINQALEITLSVERLDKYLVASGRQLSDALALYERNTKLSEAFYTPLQCMEVCLRNTLHNCLKKTYGDDWFQNGKPPLARDALQAIWNALDDLRQARKPLAAGPLVAELHFGFWVGLLGPRYDSTIWRTAFYSAFSENGGRMRRDRVHGRFNAVRRFRNRIAHHEPIFLNDLPARHNEIIEATSWMCPHTAAWALHQSRFSEVYNGT